MVEVLHAIALAVSGIIFIGCLALLYRALFGDRTSYEINRKRVGNFWDNIRGCVPVVLDGTKDSRVSAGVAINIKNNEWIEQGKLSSEAVAAVLRRHQ